MNSKRLLAIASFLDNEDKVIDVGCDHGYLGIYLKENNLVNDLLLTDINSNALDNAINNINNKGLNIKTLLTDGLYNIDLNDYNTITISGMGTSSIIDILKKNNVINKIIIQSNNNLDELRSFMNDNNYYLADEITINENNIWYVIGLFEKKNIKNTSMEIKYGLNKKDKIDYYKYLIDTYKRINDEIPLTNTDKKKEINNNIKELELLLKECR